MAATNLNIRTDKDIKDVAEKIFNELGMNMTTAINIFLRQAIRSNGIPFKVSLNTPNDITAKAIAEHNKEMTIPKDKTITNDDSVKGYTSMDELRNVLEE